MYRYQLGLEEDQPGVVHNPHQLEIVYLGLGQCFLGGCRTRE